MDLRRRNPRHRGLFPLEERSSPRGGGPSLIQVGLPIFVFILGSGVAWAQEGVIDYTGGFANSSALTANGNAAFAPVGAPTAARLTPSVTGQAGSIWYNTPVPVTSFNTAFTFQFTQPSSPPADGITFTIQNTGLTALGGFGGGLGYAGISQSVAITFKTFDGTASPNGYSNMVTNGSAVPASNSITPVSFQSADIFQVHMAYDGTTLTVVLTDASANTSYTATYPIDIPTTVGGNLAYVGFTGGTGGDYANQDILTWAYGAGLAPTNLIATPGADEATLSWTASPSATSYTVLRATQSGGPYTPIATGVTNATYLDTGSGFGSPVFYVVYAVSGGGNSLYSNEATCTPTSLISVAPTTLQVAENGGTSQFTVTLHRTPTGQVTIPVISANSAQLLLAGPGGSGGTINLVFPGGATGAGLTQTVTVTGQDQGVEAPPPNYGVQVSFGTVSCTDPTSPYQGYNSTGTVILPVACTIIPDAPGILANPPSGLATVNGGPPVTFTVQLATIPQGSVILNLSVSDPNLAIVAPPQITTAGFNSPVTVTVTPLQVNARTTFMAPYDIIIDPSTSGDGSYASLPAVNVPITTPVNIPRVGRRCGLLGGDALLPLLLLAWRRRHRGFSGRS